jgi:hypothetical protein
MATTAERNETEQDSNVATSEQSTVESRTIDPNQWDGVDISGVVYPIAMVLDQNHISSFYRFLSADRISLKLLLLWRRK